MWPFSAVSTDGNFSTLQTCESANKSCSHDLPLYCPPQFHRYRPIQPPCANSKKYNKKHDNYRPFHQNSWQKRPLNIKLHRIFMLASKYGHHKAQCTRVFPRLFSLNFDWLVELLFWLVIVDICEWFCSNQSKIARWYKEPLKQTWQAFHEVFLIIRSF